MILWIWKTSGLPTLGAELSISGHPQHVSALCSWDRLLWTLHLHCLHSTPWGTLSLQALVMSSGMGSFWTCSPHHTTPHHTTPHHTTPHHTTPHHTTPHHTTPHHTTPLVPCCNCSQGLYNCQNNFFLPVLWSFHSSAEHTPMNATLLAATHRSCGITCRPVERPSQV